jgi:glucose-1-phosphatase
MPALRTIIFDMGNVIIPFDFRRGYAAMERHCPYPASEIPDRIRPTGLVQALESGHIEPRPFVAELSKVLGFALSYEDFREIWSSIFLPDTLIPASLVETLKSQGYRVMVLSNTNAIHVEMVLERYPILHLFDHLILSHEVKAMKPDPRIYAAALAHAQAPPQECFFTDYIEDYVHGARLAGLQAEQFLGYDKLLEDLRARGVNV